jgi:hypothetical protein
MSVALGSIAEANGGASPQNPAWRSGRRKLVPIAFEEAIYESIVEEIQPRGDHELYIYARAGCV